MATISKLASLTLSSGFSRHTRVTFTYRCKSRSDRIFITVETVAGFRLLIVATFVYLLKVTVPYTLYSILLYIILSKPWAYLCELTVSPVSDFTAFSVTSNLSKYLPNINLV